MNKKKDFIKFCKYYKGEEQPPFKDNDKMALWEYEKKWVEFNLTNKEVLVDFVDDYVSVGLSMFSSTDDTPVSLKALLFNRFVKGFQSMIDAVEPFKEYYNKMYL